MKKLSILTGLVVGGLSIAKSKNLDRFSFQVSKYGLEHAETVIVPLSDSIKPIITSFNLFKLGTDSINLAPVRKTPFSSVGELIEGRHGGIYVQKRSGEPGSYQNILLRGLSGVQGSNRDANNNQASVYVNGVPIVFENPFAYDIQRNDFNRIGPATDYLHSLDMETIESIEIIQDPVRLAQLGPLANKGAIWIKTREGKSGKAKLSVNGYYGVNLKPNITPLNAAYENDFRRVFYQKYAEKNSEEELNYPRYLVDQMNSNFYGNSDWKDIYFSNQSFYSLNVHLRGGSDRANFNFSGGHTKNSVSADEANLRRYTTLFNINMLPFKWFTVSTWINARRTERDRNRSLRDRYNEMGYTPDLTTPLSPGRSLFSEYLRHYTSEGVDDNVTNHIQGELKLSFKILQNLNYSSSFQLDYNEGIRDLFYPKGLMDGINYTSNYFGYSQRIKFLNNVEYRKTIGDNIYSILLGSDYTQDLFRYNYTKAFDGTSDYIKLNVVEGDASRTDEYLIPRGGLSVNRLYNREMSNLHSISSFLSYEKKDLLNIKAVLRWDGSSNVQRDSRWIFTPAIGAKLNLNKLFETKNEFSAELGFSRIGNPQLFNSRFATGPQYAGNLGWTQDPMVSSYHGYAGISRDYNYGWIGYDLNWSYSDRYEFIIRKGMLSNRIGTSVKLYQRDDKQQIISVPVSAEYGYISQYRNGLELRNQGVEFAIDAQVFAGSKNLPSWNTSLNVNINRNKLMGLPEGRSSLKYGEQLLVVGNAIDKFWLYENQGIYNDVNDIPAHIVNEKVLHLSNNGIPYNVGDAKWRDRNGDYLINEHDKVLKGRFTPAVYGGLNNSLFYKSFDLNFSFVYALGLDVLNRRAANRYDFINIESEKSLGGIKEIFQWQQDVNIDRYPLYNVWSGTNPYRFDQDLFLEDASYAKLRSVSFGFDFCKLKKIPHFAKGFKRAYIFLNANNLFTITKFSGVDPELINFNGVYDGYGMPLPKSLMFGFKLEL